MRKVWDIVADEQHYHIDVDWDVTMSGSGWIVVNGVEVSRWGWGVKWPGVSHDFVIGARSARVTQSFFGFEIAVEGVPVESARRTNGFRPVTVAAGLIAAVFVLLVVGIALLIMATLGR